MDIRKDFNIKRSFAAKVCFWTLVTSTCIFIICFGSALCFANQSMLDEGHEKANLELDKAILFVEKEINSVEVAGNNFAALWSKNEILPEDKVYGLCRNFIKHNRQIQGVCIAFEPQVYPKYKKGFAPYIMIDSKGKKMESNLSDKYNIWKRYWYIETMRSGKNYWTHPFVESNGTIVCTYCIPLISSKGKKLGVFAFDLSLEQLTEHLQSIKPYPNAILTILDRHFTYVVHPDRDMIMKANKATHYDKNSLDIKNNILTDLRDHKRGHGEIEMDGDKKYLYYAPIKALGWTVTLTCDKDEITADIVPIRCRMIICSILGIIGLYFIILVIIRKFLQPVKYYSRAALQIAQGNFHTRIPKTRDHNELWALGNSLDHMQQSLEQYINELKATTQEKGRIESELRIASEIQMSMVPKTFPPFPNRDDIDLYGILIPAKAVGGDLYDFILRDEKLFFCIGDVSGKGVPASLLMAVTRSLLRMVAAQESHPDKIVTAVNAAMADMNESNMFVTLFFGVLDLPTGRFRYCNAGHDAPILINEKTQETKKLDVIPNLPIGITTNMKYTAQETTITPGTSIFMYTDGLTEAENKEHELLGKGKMADALIHTIHMESKQRIEYMLDAVHQHVDQAEQSDDLTMFCIKYKRLKRDTKYYNKLLLHNNIEEVPMIETFIDDLVGKTGISMGTASKLNLALEEAIVNVMNYAYPKEQIGNIYLEVYANDARIKFVITDHGTPFDPTAAAEPDITADLEDRPIGGLGIFLVRQLMDSVNYERINGDNILTLRMMIDTENNQAGA